MCILKSSQSIGKSFKAPNNVKVERIFKCYDNGITKQEVN